MLRESLGGWSFAGLAILESGFALSPSLSTSTMAKLPVRMRLARSKRSASWASGLTPQNYAQAPYGFYGDASNGSIRDPAEFTGNTALYKTFSIRKKFDLQFRAEAFNIANHPNYDAVSTSYGAENFGAVTSALGPRILEFALRASF